MTPRPVRCSPVTPCRGSFSNRDTGDRRMLLHRSTPMDVNEFRAMGHEVREIPCPYDGQIIEDSWRYFGFLAWAFIGGTRLLKRSRFDPEEFVHVDTALVRPAEVDTLLADPTKAREELGWFAKTSFKELIQIMVESDLELQEKSSGRRRGQGPSR